MVEKYRKSYFELLDHRVMLFFFAGYLIFERVLYQIRELKCVAAEVMWCRMRANPSPLLGSVKTTISVSLNYTLKTHPLVL